MMSEVGSDRSAQTALRRPLAALLTALGFLSVLPAGSAVRDDRSLFGAGLFYFAPVGLLLGTVAAALWLLLDQVVPSPVGAALLVAIVVALTGGLHLDGLADTADGFCSGQPRERCLEIMRDSRIGVMGALAVAVLLIIKTTAVAAIADKNQVLIAVPIAMMAGRTAMVCLMAVLPYARAEGGLGRLFYGPAVRQAAILSLLLLIGVLLLVGGRAVPLLIVGGIIFWGMVGICRSKIGGATGDTLGAISEVIETAILVVFTGVL